MDNFKEAIKPYKDLLEARIPKETKKKRDRKSDYIEDIWKLYDLYLKTKKNKVETTRQCFNVSGNPIHNFDENLLKRVITAVTNAEKIIATGRKEYGLR
ncbi:MAG: hypothetical protein ACLP9S_00595 [Syntrophales bacterium]